MPKVDENGKPIYLFPFVLEGKEGINFEKQGIDKNCQTLYGSITLDKVPAGTEIVAPYDGYAFQSISSHNGREPRVSRIRIAYKTEIGDIYWFDIANSHQSTSLHGLETSNNTIPVIGEENSNGRDYQKGTFVQKGDLLGSTINDLSHVSIQQKRVLEEDFYNNNSHTTDNINFLSERDKLITQELPSNDQK